MPKFFGKIGYAESVETSPGIWEEQITERNFYGEWARNSRQLQNSNNINDDIKISNELSIVSDPYSSLNFLSMRYAEFMGAKWKINSVDVKYPRLILSLGGLYNGQ